jgi:hypothetical protein
VQFVDDGFFPPVAAPSLALPSESAWIDHFAWSMHILWLEAGCWIRNFLAAIDSETILRPGLGFVTDQLKPTVI